MQLSSQAPRPSPGASGQPAISVMVVAGEVSGDQHTAGVVRALMERAPGSKVFGMGGSHLRAAGMEILVDSEKSASVMGLTEVIGSARSIISAFRRLRDEAERRRPAVAVLVDFPDFNLRLAKALHARGIPVLYFISPQLWAWRRSRVRQIQRYVAKVLPIFPFEEAFYREHGVAAEYVGHPFMDRPPLELGREEFLRSAGCDPAHPVVALLPGSRKSEVALLLPQMLEAFAVLRSKRPELQGLLPVAESLPLEEMTASAAGTGVRVIRGQARQVLAAADAAVVASGTATVEAALAQVPFVVVYRLSPITYWIARRLVRGVEHVAMVNLIAGKRVVEELLQEQATGERIAEELARLLDDPARAERMRFELGQVAEKLGAGGPSGQSCAARVADAIIEQARAAAQR